MTTEEFQTELLESSKGVAKTVKTLEQKNAELLGNVDNLDKETKKALEELTKLKNEFAPISEKLVAIEKVNLQLSNERRMAFGGGIEGARQRLLADEEGCKNIIRAVCRAIQVPVPKAIGEDTSPGSTLILDKNVGTEVYNLLLGYGQFTTLGVKRMTTKVEKFPVKTARPVAGFLLTEGATIPDDTNKAGTSVDCSVLPIGVLLNVSLQLIQDGVIDIAADIMDDFAQALAYRLDYAAFRGNGTADTANGGYTGLFNFFTSCVATTGRTTIAATTVDDWIKALTTVDAAVLSRGPKWWMYPTLVAAALGVKDANGRSIFLTALEAPSYGAIGSILGFPVIPTNVAPSTNTVNSQIAAFGDPQAMVVGLRTDFDIDFSDHAGWTTYQRSFRGIGRAGIRGRKATGGAVLTLPAS